MFSVFKPNKLWITLVCINNTFKGSSNNISYFECVELWNITHSAWFDLVFLLEPVEIGKMSSLFFEQSRGVGTQNGTSDNSTFDTFDPRLPTIDSNTKIDFRQCRSVGSPTPVSERPALLLWRAHTAVVSWGNQGALARTISVLSLATVVGNIHTAV